MSKRGSRKRTGSANRFVFPSHLRDKTINTTFRPNTNGRVALRGIDNGYSDNLVPAEPVYTGPTIAQENRAAVAYNDFGNHPQKSTAILLYFGAHPSSHGIYIT